MGKTRIALLAAMLSGMTGLALADTPPDSPTAKREAAHLDQLPPVKPAGGTHIDRSGRKQQGRASFYSKHFSNKTMADGRKLNPNAPVAASKTLPLGSVAKVTNLQNGKSTTVRIEDRGPYANGRIVDLTPRAANQIDLNKQGVAPVEVKPVTIPTTNGGVKLGAGAAEVAPHEVEAAVHTTEQLASPKEAANTRR